MTDTQTLNDAIRGVETAIDQTINRLAHPSGRDMAQMADELLEARLCLRLPLRPTRYRGDDLRFRKGGCHWTTSGTLS